MFQPEGFKNPDMKIPWMPIARVKVLFEKAGAHRDAYVDAHDELISQGWTFQEQVEFIFEDDDWLNSTSQSFDGDLWPWGEWDPVYKSGQFLPKNEAAWCLFFDQWETQLGFLGLLMDLDHAWEYTVGGVLGIIDLRLSWFCGVVMRVTNRFVQHKVAKCLQNAFCMDHRGRPV